MRPINITAELDVTSEEFGSINVQANGDTVYINIPDLRGVLALRQQRNAIVDHVLEAVQAILPVADVRFVVQVKGMAVAELSQARPAGLLARLAGVEPFAINPINALRTLS